MNLDKKIAAKLFEDIRADGYLNVITSSNTEWFIWQSDDIKPPFNFKIEVTDNAYEKYVMIYQTLSGYIDIEHDDIQFYQKFIKEFTAYYSKNSLSVPSTIVNAIEDKLKELWV